MIGNLSNELTEILDTLVESIKSGDLALFFGSGISVYPPSNLPVSSELRSSLFNQLLNTKPLLIIKKRILMDKSLSEAKERILFGFIKNAKSDLGMEYTVNHYPFELFIETIHEYTNYILPKRIYLLSQS